MSRTSTQQTPAALAGLLASDFDDQHDQYNFCTGARDVYVARDQISRSRYVYCVGIVGDPHSQVTETTFAAAKTTAAELLR